MRKGLATLSAFLVSVLAVGQNMRHEADSFIAGMPENLQSRQECAVREAIGGNLSLLESVRNSRNTAQTLPEGVSTIDIEGKYRLYRPVACGKDPIPVLVYLHGGGWCFGSINSCAAFCASLALCADVAVLAVDYPLAPEHPYPEALDSCLDALDFIHANAERYKLDTSAVSVGGDSAGGNLAIATALKLIDAPCRISLKSLVLFYPVLRAWNDKSPSWEKYAVGYALDGGIMEAFNQAYVGAYDPKMPLISPLCADAGSLAKLPPTLIINAERDILCSQGEDMSRCLEKAGASVRREVFDGAVHLFITVSGQPTAFNRAVELTGEFLKTN